MQSRNTGILLINLVTSKTVICTSLSRCCECLGYERGSDKQQYKEIYSRLYSRKDKGSVGNVVRYRSAKGNEVEISKYNVNEKID